MVCHSVLYLILCCVKRYPSLSCVQQRVKHVTVQNRCVVNICKSVSGCTADTYRCLIKLQIVNHCGMMYDAAVWMMYVSILLHEFRLHVYEWLI